jgi:membrane protease YdiL (CAAX protease family)
MNKGLKFLLVMAGIMGLSIVLAPILYHFLSSFFNFDNIFNRLVMVFTIAAAVLFVLIPNIKKGSAAFDRETWREYGFDFSRPWKRLFGRGFLIGALFVAVLAAIEVVFGPRYLRSPLEFQDILERFGKGMMSGMIVGIVEEFFFRGFIYGVLRKKLNVFVAVISASIFYSLCHFFENGKILIPEHPGVWDSIRLLAGYLEPLVMRPEMIRNEFIGLFLFGLVLNIAFVRTRSLFLPMGIHAGAVFLIKWQSSFVRAGDDIEHPFFQKLPYYDGSVEWVALILLGVAVWFLTRKGPVSSH